jgi:hypothetical protein|nr:MAG: Protein of unknown function (DUF1642) [Bacteriophage sp.]
MMNKDEATNKLSKAAGLSMAHAEDLYDSFFEKPVVPQYVADWYEENKKDFDYNLWDYLTSWDRQKGSDFKKWIDNEIDVLQTLVNMHQFGYEVEKETKYTVRIKVTNQYLCNDDGILHFSPGFRMDFTKNDLEKLNLGWVFDCEGIEIVEVE